MAGEATNTPTPTPTASTQQPDVNQQIAALTGAVTQLAQGQAALVQALQGQQQAGQAAQQGQQAAGKKDGPLTGADVTRIVQEALAAQQQASQQTAARQQFQEGKLKDLPPAYRNQLGTDPGKWAQEEQAIREQFRADFKAAGGKVEDVGGGGGGGTPAGQMVDTSKLSAQQLAEMALKTGRPVAGQQAVTTTAAAGGQQPGQQQQGATGAAGATTAAAAR